MTFGRRAAEMLSLGLRRRAVGCNEHDPKPPDVPVTVPDHRSPCQMAESRRL